jgi:acetyl-CoA acetyltransferase
MTEADEIGIIGIGIHPFGRHPETSGLGMAAVAARAALADAGVRWEEVDFAAGVLTPPATPTQWSRRSD